MTHTEVYEQLRTFINGQVPFARLCGIEVSELGVDGATATLPEDPELLNHVATQHAGALFTLAESASGACMLGVVGERFASITPLVRRSTISYRRPARGPITATARSDVPPSTVDDGLAAQGRCDFDVQVQLHDTAGDLVATAEMAWHVRVREGSAP